mmetsp:Transcript_39845/g.126120  ORF Transcript_39845/g.126120 Transcript_39845/m.126120 type:complete len:275 (+) Transcript_39845:172-996(+)
MTRRGGQGPQRRLCRGPRTPHSAPRRPPAWTMLAMGGRRLPQSWHPLCPPKPFRQRCRRRRRRRQLQRMGQRKTQLKWLPRRAGDPRRTRTTTKATSGRRWARRLRRRLGLPSLARLPDILLDGGGSLAKRRRRHSLRLRNRERPIRSRSGRSTDTCCLRCRPRAPYGLRRLGCCTACRNKAASPPAAAPAAPRRLSPPPPLPAGPPSPPPSRRRRTPLHGCYCADESWTCARRLPEPRTVGEVAAEAAAEREGRQRRSQMSVRRRSSAAQGLP